MENMQNQIIQIIVFMLHVHKVDIRHWSPKNILVNAAIANTFDDVKVQSHKLIDHDTVGEIILK